MKNWFFSSQQRISPPLLPSPQLSKLSDDHRNGLDTAQVEEIINSTVIGHNETKQKEIVKLSLSMSTDGLLYTQSSWTDSFWPSI
jgi:hypothetical protein